jgi:hypothetical protein
LLNSPTFRCGFLPRILILLMLGVMLPSGPARAAPDFIPLEELEPGMTGYGLTVFEGTRVDTFQVTVIGVQEKIRAAGSLLLIEVAGHGLEISSIAQGMSGSPIFIDGRFAGALAFGWGGALRPIAGVTPAAEILALPDRPTMDPAVESQAVSPDLGTLVSPAWQGGGLGTELFGLESTREPAAGVRNVPLWPAPERLAQNLLQGWLPDLTSGGPDPAGWICRPASAGLSGGAAGTTDADLTLVAGSACSIPLVAGDAQLGVMGTVTWVEGDRVLMMGHPFMQRGPISFPLATAEILTLFPSRQMSFKMGSLGTVVGTVHSDQRAGLAGRLGPSPRMIPVTVDLVRPEAEGSTRTFNFEVADDSQMTPPLVFWTLYNSLLVEGDDASRQTLRYTLETTWSGDEGLAAEPLVLKGVVAGPGGAMGLASEWMAPLMVLLGNSHRPLKLEEVSATFEVTRPMDTATIVGLSGPRSLPAPGSEVVFQVEIQPHLGARQTIEVPVILPDVMQPGPYRVVAASAAELFSVEAQRATGRFQGPSLENLITLLRTERSPADLVVALLAPGSGLVIQGAEMTQLPPSVNRLLRTGNMQATPTLADYILRQNIPTDWALAGNAVRAVQLDPPSEPLTEERRP